MSLLIKNGRIITEEKDYFADIYIEKERISAVGSSLSIPADRIIDAAGKYVIPGGIDVHTHLDMPLGAIASSDDFETGTIAAAFGGTTSLIDFAAQPKGKSMREGLDIWRKKAEGKAAIDYGFHMTITDLPDARLNEMKEMVEEGVTSFKLFLAYPDALMADDAAIFKALKQTSKSGGLVCIHAENGMVIDQIVKETVAMGNLSPLYHALSRPPAAEGESTNRAIALAEMAGAPVYIVHLTCSDALAKVADSRSKGQRVFAETCPQYLWLSLEDIAKPDFEGAKYVFSPPVREKWNQEKLWTGLQTNDLQVVSTDHCPFNFKVQKEMGKDNFTKIPNGGPGIENRMHLIFHGGVNQKRISLNRWIELTSVNPAKIFGMYPRKGAIAPGSDADIVIWDPQREFTISAKTHHMRVDYSMYEGKQVKGDADLVISRGRVIVEEKKFLGSAGSGNFIKRDPNIPAGIL
jgi:dihydropyrimidinase